MKYLTNSKIYDFIIQNEILYKLCNTSLREIQITHTKTLMDTYLIMKLVHAECLVIFFDTEIFNMRINSILLSGNEALDGREL